MPNICKKPESLSVDTANQIIESIFNPDVTDISVFEKLNVEIESVDSGYLVTVKRSQQKNWDRAWPKGLNLLFKETYSNGWKIIVDTNSLSTSGSEIEPSTEPTSALSEIANNMCMSAGEIELDSVDDIVGEFLDFGDATSEDTEKTPETTEEAPAAAVTTPVKAEESVKKNTKPNTVPLSSIPELTIADEIELGRKASLSEEIIAFYTNERFNVYQMDEIRKGFENGIDAKSYADPERPWYSMMANRIYLEQRRG